MRIEAKKTVDQAPDWINLVLGILLFLSPWALQYAAQPTVALNAWIGGGVVAVLALAALANFAEWEEWINTAVGIWVAVSPWVLGFSAVTAAMGSHVVLGVLIAALAAWRGWRAHSGGEHRHA